jgi:hypothetical protein
MSKLIFYVLFGCNPADSSKLLIYNGSSRNLYILVSSDKNILVSKEKPLDNITFFRFNYFKNRYIQRDRPTKFLYSSKYDTVLIERNKDVTISFRAIKTNSSDTIPIQNLFWLQLNSARVGVIKKGDKKYYPLKSKKNLFYDYRNFIK